MRGLKNTPAALCGMASEVERIQANIAQNLIALRGHKGLSQEALAHAAGIDRTFVSRIERQLANPSLSTLCALAKVLGVSAVRLLSTPS